MEKNLPSFKRLYESRESLESELAAHASSSVTHRFIVKYLGTEPFPQDLKGRYPDIDFFSVCGLGLLAKQGIQYLAYPVPLALCKKTKFDLPENLWREVDIINAELRTRFGCAFTSQVLSLSEAVLKWESKNGKDSFSISDIFKQPSSASK